MEGPSPPDPSVPEDVDGYYDSGQSYVDSLQSNCSSVTGDVSVNDLVIGLTESLCIQDDQSKIKIDNADKESIRKEPRDEDAEEEEVEEEEEEEEEEDITAEILARSGYAKSKPQRHSPVKSLPNTIKPVSTVNLGIGLIESLCIQDDQHKNEIDSADKVEEDAEEEEEEDDDITAEILARSGYAKSEPPRHSPVKSLPNTIKLVSAMKGSREKQGIAPKNLSVTWSPEVYDPPPTAETHFATSKTQRHRSTTKKNAKSKQEWGGKPSLGKAKKKQVRKYGGSSSNRCLQSLDNDERLVYGDEPYDDFEHYL